MRSLTTLLCFIAITAAAQSPAPAYRVGDVWLYRYEQVGVEARNRRAEIASVDDSKIIVQWGPAGKPRGQQTFSPALNEYDPDGVEVVRVRHPLVVGDSWESQWKWTSPEGDHGHSKLTRKVVAMEQIRVGSMDLECYRIEANGFWYGSTPSIFPSTDRMTEKYWYCPKAKTIAKFEGMSFQHNSITYWLRYQLLTAHVDPDTIR
jgi:hypothetical protein